MRIIVPHKKSREDVIQTIDRSLNELLQQPGTLPVQLLEPQRSWQGSTLKFSLTAKMGFLSTPIKGTAEVTDHDVTIDVDFGIFERMIPAEKAQDLITSRIRGLLK
jgi:hypothetical protein